MTAWPQRRLEVRRFTFSGENWVLEPYNSCPQSGRHLFTATSCCSLKFLSQDKSINQKRDEIKTCHLISSHITWTKPVGISYSSAEGLVRSKFEHLVQSIQCTSDRGCRQAGCPAWQQCTSQHWKKQLSVIANQRKLIYLKVYLAQLQPQCANCVLLHWITPPGVSRAWACS